MRRSMSVFSPLSLRSPFTLLNDLDKYYGDWSAMPARFSEGECLTPKVSTREGQYAYHIDVDLPGVAKDDIHMESELLPPSCFATLVGARADSFRYI